MFFIVLMIPIQELLVKQKKNLINLKSYLKELILKEKIFIKVIF